MDNITPLQNQRCITCTNGMPALSDSEAQRLQAALPEWQREGQTIVRTYRFKDHYETLAFVNALAWLSHRTDHHPD
ncbi:MAG: 4a-hydroxytetrahydrobiopterin dehydratase, partial [Rhodocyclaceae bacterium]|nr:4a-hydroxytetrahydrobiopterin dehydratase [Rhodocyclaceae bacterium]